MPARRSAALGLQVLGPFFRVMQTIAFHAGTRRPTRAALPHFSTRRGGEKLAQLLEIAPRFRNKMRHPHCTGLATPDAANTWRFEREGEHP